MLYEDNIIWIDLEMTGLCPNDNVIIEIATIITDGELNKLAEGPVLAIYQPDECLAAMDEWNTNQHNRSGLSDRVRKSRVKAVDAEQQTIQFLRQWVAAGISPMAGNSVCQDRRFLANYMPQLEKYFHYRNLDVSTIKELARLWKPNILADFSKSGKHLALDDILDSINELKYYRKTLFALAL